MSVRSTLRGFLDKKIRSSLSMYNVPLSQHLKEQGYIIIQSHILFKTINELRLAIAILLVRYE